jgi:hypothetical protein
VSLLAVVQEFLPEGQVATAPPEDVVHDGLLQAVHPDVRQPRIPAARAMIQT